MTVWQAIIALVLLLFSGMGAAYVVMLVAQQSLWFGGVVMVVCSIIINFICLFLNEAIK